MGPSEISYEELFERASVAATEADCESCLNEIERGLELATASADRARLLMCRARVHSNRWRTAEVCNDTRAAMGLFEVAGERDLAADAASWAAAHASRLGDLTLATELATKSLLALESVADDRVKLEILNRLGIFCYSFLDYDRAIEQFEASLAAAERTGNQPKIYRQVHNIADALLVAVRQRELAGAGTGAERVERAEALARWLLDNATEEFNRAGATYRLLAEALCERGRAGEGLVVLDRFRSWSADVGPVAQRAALAWVEARCLRNAGDPGDAIGHAAQAVALARSSADDHELMLALEELGACQEAAGELEAAVATAREVKARMWTIHQRQTRQLVSEVWARADLLRDHHTLRSQAAEASRWAEEDPLTGIGNRRRLERFVQEGLVEHGRLSFIVLDVDHFKTINDSLGHELGDMVLTRVGKLLGEQIRAGQVAIRHGGDEFVIGLAGVELDVAARIAERLRRTVEGLDWESLSPSLRVTTSCGVACGETSRWEVAFSAADAALYSAKRQGRNAVAVAGE